MLCQFTKMTISAILLLSTLYSDSNHHQYPYTHVRIDHDHFYLTRDFADDPEASENTIFIIHVISRTPPCYSERLGTIAPRTPAASRRLPHRRNCHARITIITVYSFKWETRSLLQVVTFRKFWYSVVGTIIIPTTIYPSKYICNNLSVNTIIGLNIIIILVRF